MVGVEQPRRPTDFSTETLEIIEMVVITAAVHSDTQRKPGPVLDVCNQRFSLLCGVCRFRNQGWMRSREHRRWHLLALQSGLSRAKFWLFDLPPRPPLFVVSAMSDSVMRISSQVQERVTLQVGVIFWLEEAFVSPPRIVPCRWWPLSHTCGTALVSLSRGPLMEMGIAASTAL